MGSKRVMNEASQIGTLMRFPKFSVFASVLSLGFSVAFVKKCAAPEVSVLGLSLGALGLLGTGETTAQDRHLYTWSRDASAKSDC